MILVLNCGSQSIKWKVFEKELKLVAAGERFLLDKNLFQKSLKEELEKISGFKISLIGHRVVHGDKIFIKPTKINEFNLQELEKLNHLAPLHNPFSVLGIKGCRQFFKNIDNIAVFDTEFFENMPEIACTYALPQEIAKELGIRRYGFHGISHEYTAKLAAEKLKKPFDKIKIITCHLGGGSSITATKDGKAVDTSMGFTPLEGLVMMTRPGNIDAGIILELAKKYGVEKTGDILNNESGVKGICREGDMLRVLEKVKSGDKAAKLALDIFVYSIKKYVGAYYAILGGCDVLVFTGAIGEGSAKIRNMVCKDLDILKKTKILAIETDEEKAIANKINKLL